MQNDDTVHDQERQSAISNQMISDDKSPVMPDDPQEREHLLLKECHKHAPDEWQCHNWIEQTDSQIATYRAKKHLSGATRERARQVRRDIERRLAASHIGRDLMWSVLGSDRLRPRNFHKQSKPTLEQRLLLWDRESIARMTVAGVAGVLGCSEATVRLHLWKHSIACLDYPKRRLTRYAWHQITQLEWLSLTDKEIASRLGVRNSCVVSQYRGRHFPGLDRRSAGVRQARRLLSRALNDGLNKAA